jgi:DNA-binding transcriptional ArsR family regulator
MRNKRKGIDIRAKTFRVVPDEMVEAWWSRELDATTIMVWISLQRLAVSSQSRLTFTEIARTCRVSKSTLSSSLRKLVERGLLQRVDGGFKVVYDDGGSKIEPSGSIFDPSGSKIEPSGSKIEPSGSKIEPSGSKIEPSGSKIEPHLSSDAPRIVKRDRELRKTLPGIRTLDAEIGGACVLCGSYSHIPISQYSEEFRKRFGLGSHGYICEACVKSKLRELLGATPATSPAPSETPAIPSLTNPVEAREFAPISPAPPFLNGGERHD